MEVLGTEVSRDRAEVTGMGYLSQWDGEQAVFTEDNHRGEYGLQHSKGTGLGTAMMVSKDTDGHGYGHEGGL